MPASARFAADDQAVREGVGCARRFARRADLGDDAVARLCIVVEELVTNVIEHGTPPADSEIALDFALKANAVALTLSDAGPLFDPCRAELPAVIPERGGGAGLALVRNWASAFDYERREGRNVVRLLLPVSAR